MLDVPNLAHRALWATGAMTHAGRPTGVLFGLFRAVADLTRRFDTAAVAWCFDAKPLLRAADFPGYKARTVDAKKGEMVAGMETQLAALRADYLPRLGYGNVFVEPGYEADDLMAMAAAWLPPGDRAILVSGDRDLYQLLSRTCAVYHPTPQTFVTAKSFKAEWNIPPRAWATVKAIAGCDTDSVPGVYGVGEKTAAAFLRGGFLGDKAKQKLIDRFIASHDYHRNQKLVRLPYPGLAPIKLTPDRPPARAAWRAACSELGFASLAGAEPGGIDL